MQRIERYGVIALVFLLVTIVAVSLWGEQKKSDGFFSFLKRDSKSAQVERLLAGASQERASALPETARRTPLDRSLPLSTPPAEGELVRAFAGPRAAPEGLNEFAPQEQRVILPDAKPELGRPPVREALQPEQPAREVAAREPAAEPASREYTIKAGDTLSEIAQRELGTQGRWRELLDANPGLDPARLAVGRVIGLPGAGARPAPARAALAEATPEQPAPSSPAAARTGERRSYTIRAGDTLSQIAQDELGTQARWRELLEINPGLEPSRLAVGQRILLPAGSASAGERVVRAEPKPSRVARSGSRVR